jgi:predicted phosphodiesterase
MIKRVLILPDAHINTKVPKEYEVVKRFIKDFKPHETILLGDFMDVSVLSAWDLDKKRVMEGQRYNKEVVVANKELDFLQKHSKKTTFLEGNHEYRVERYLDKNPEMDGLINVPIVLRLKERHIKFYPLNETYKVGKCFFIHGLFTTKYSAAKHLEALGENVVYGHTHQSSSYFKTAKLRHSIMAYNIGCLCDKAPDYMKGKWANWITGFAVMYYDDKSGLFNLYPINIIKNQFFWNGRCYK